MKNGWLWAALLVSAIPGGAFAQSALSLQEALAQALASHPMLMAGEQRIGAAVLEILFERELCLLLPIVATRKDLENLVL